MSAYATAMGEASREDLLVEVLRQHDRAEVAEAALATAREAAHQQCIAGVSVVRNHERRWMEAHEREIALMDRCVAAEAQLAAMQAENERLRADRGN